MADTNQYGLSRDIPGPVMRQVRQQSGFGCVVCGCAIYQYEHFNPPFANAKEHDARGITLLCGTCHDRSTKGLLSKPTLVAAVQAPKCLLQGYSFGPFDVGDMPPEVIAGTFHAIETRVIIRVLGLPVLAVDPPEKTGGPFQLSAVLCDNEEKVVLQIDHNEWKAPIENWDVEVVGRHIVCRRGAGDITLHLRSEPPHLLVVERLNMFYRGFRLVCEEGKHMTAVTPAGQVFQTQAMTARKCEVGIELLPNGFIVGQRCESLYIGSAAGWQLPQGQKP